MQDVTGNSILKGDSVQFIDYDEDEHPFLNEGLVYHSEASCVLFKSSSGVDHQIFDHRGIRVLRSEVTMNVFKNLSEAFFNVGLAIDLEKKGWRMVWSSLDVTHDGGWFDHRDQYNNGILIRDLAASMYVFLQKQEKKNANESYMSDEFSRAEEVQLILKELETEHAVIDNEAFRLKNNPNSTSYQSKAADALWDHCYKLKVRIGAYKSELSTLRGSK